MLSMPGWLLKSSVKTLAQVVAVVIAIPEPTESTTAGSGRFGSSWMR
jgi:hypothetical protein